MGSISYAPWTPEQVANLLEWQECGHVHPFTGVTVAGAKVDLIPTAAGWIAEEGGEVVQNWAHDYMVEGKGWWKDVADASPTQ